MESAFKAEWGKLMSFNSLTPLAKWHFYQLVTKGAYSKLSTTKIESITYISKSTVSRIRRGEIKVQDPNKEGISDDTEDDHHQPKKKRGRPNKLTEEDQDYIINKARERRSKFMAVSIKWATNELNNILKARGFRVSRFTIRRLFGRRGWRKRKSMRKQSYCLTENYSTIINNWRNRMREIFKKNPTATVHVMDESGVYTNMLPRYTFVESTDKFANVNTHHDTTKDSIIVTISSNGNGDLFYVPFRAATENRKGCSGVGLDEMKKWVAHFLQFANKGDVLLMDNLAAHHHYSIRKTLEDNGIIVKYFPVRGASKLSPLDNCFLQYLNIILGKGFLN